MKELISKETLKELKRIKDIQAKQTRELIEASYEKRNKTREEI